MVTFRSCSIARGAISPNVLALLVLLASSPARAQSPAPPEPEPAPEPAAPDFETVSASAADPATSKRNALFDIAIAAMAHGDLVTAERAFADAAAVPGDAVRASVAFSFAERVRRLREKRVRAVAMPFSPDASLRVRAAPPAPVPAAERSQRTSFVGISSLLGATVYGWALPAALDMSLESPRRFMGVYMLTTASSFLIPYFGTRGQPVSAAQVDLAFYGGTRGAWHGVLLGAMFAGNLEPDRDFRAWSRAVLFGSLAELSAGYFLAGHTRMSAGQTHTMAALGDLGLLSGVGVGFALHLNQRDTADQQARGMAASSITGAALGLASGYALGLRRDNTWGDAEVLRLGGLLGGLTGFGIADLFQLEIDLEKRPVSILAVSGGLVGLYIGDRLVRRTDLTVSQALLVDLGTAAAALGGAGLTYLFAPDHTDEFGAPKGFQPPYLLAAAVGGAAGLGLSYWQLHDRSSGRAPRRGLSSRNRPGANVALLPLVARTGERGAALVGRF